MEEKMSVLEAVKGYSLLFLAGVGVYTIGKEVAGTITKYRTTRRIEECTAILQELSNRLVEEREEGGTE